MNRVPNQERLLQQILAERKDLVEGKGAALLGAYKRFFESADGRLIVEDMKESYFKNLLTPGYSDVTAYKIGRSSVVEDMDNTYKLALAVLPALPPTSDRR